MKIGDLVKVKECASLDTSHALYEACECFFCSSVSNRVGVVFGIAPRNQFHVMFDVGAWRLDDFDVANGDVEVISESR